MWPARPWFPASTLDPADQGPALPSWTRRARRKLVGKTVAERALQAGIKKVVFDRGGYVYTGRVAAGRRRRP